MRGAILRSIRTAFVCLALVTTVAGRAPFVHADPPALEFLRDTIIDDTPGAPNIGHDIYFVVPLNAQQISPSNYIFIDLPNFNHIIPPGQVNGAFGNPIISITGTRISIHNLVILPGTGISLVGLSAANPPAGANFNVTVSLADDSTGNVIRNQSTVPASKGTGVTAVSATVQSTLASITINGFTSPGAFVIVQEGGSVVGTTTSTGNGFFTVSLNGLTSGTYTYEVSSTDSENRTTSQAVVQTFLLTSSNTTVSNLLLSPTLELDKAQINPGDTLTVSGLAKPASQIDIFSESPLTNYTTQSDNNGNFSYTFQASDTQNYVLGQHRVYTIVEDDVGNQSLVSPTVNFTVTAANASPGDNPPPNCNISQGDLNCDGKTNLSDFSILLFHWKTNHRVADINGDGSVNLLDFSIMMFYFHR